MGGSEAQCRVMPTKLCRAPPELEAGDSQRSPAASQQGGHAVDSLSRMRFLFLIACASDNVTEKDSVQPQ